MCLKPGDLHRCCLLIAVLMIGPFDLGASWLDGTPVTQKQPDGTEIELLLSGDTHYSWLHDAAGYVILRHPESNDLVYADKVDGELVATSLVVGQADPAAHQLRPDLMPDVLPGRTSRVTANSLASTTGFTEVNNLVIFVRFAGEAEYGSWKWRYNRIFNTTPEGSISVKSYFQEVSYNQLTIDSHLLPTPAENGKISSYQDIHDRRYYQRSSSYNPNGYQGDAAERELGLFQRAVAAVADQVPSSLELDSNDDGYVDSVTFVIKDFPGGASILIPHHSTLYGTASINGLPVAAYNVVFDKALDADVICHQMMHLFGAPDLSRSWGCGESGLPVGPWDIMSSWQSQPPQPSAYIKHRYTGWIDTIPEISTSGVYTLNPLTSPTNNAFKIASPNSNLEYFILEYRQKSTTSVVDSDLPGSGLLVYRINPQGTNACGPPNEVYLFRPGGTSSAGDIFSAHLSADVGRTELTDTSNPAAVLSNGGSAGLSITDIGAAGETISFTADIQQPCQIGSFSLVSPAPDEQIFGFQATLEWSVADGADSYQVYLGAEQDGLYYADTSLYATTSDNTFTADLGYGAYYWKVLASNGECSNITTPAETRRFVLTPEPEQIELGDTITELSGDAGSWRYYTFEVPEYMWQLNVNASVDTGEISLHLQYGEPPDVTRTSIHCHPNGLNPDWWCQYRDPIAGLWHLAVKAVSDYSGVDLQVSIDPIPPASGYMVGFYPFLVPIAAHSDGLDDSSWVSDLTILNRSAPAIADLYFLRRNQDSSQAAGIRMELPQNSAHHFSDVVRETFGIAQGSGAVLIRSNGKLIVSSRTYNDQASGTYGQFVPGVKEWDMVAPNREVRLIQLTRNAGFRTNFGIANSMAGMPISVEVGLYQADGTLIDTRQIRVEPYSMRMVTDIFATDVEDGYIIARNPISGFFCFASVVDIHTGDAMLVTPAEAVRSVAVVPASINAPGVGGVLWRTDLELHNPGADLLVADIVLLRDTVDGSPEPTTQVEVPAGQSLRLSNALATLFGYTGAAALRIAPTTPGELMVASRTYTQVDDGSGTYGQMIPGVPWRSCAAAGGMAYLTQLQQSDDPGTGFRTNIGFVNPDDESVLVEVELYGEVTFDDGKAESQLIATRDITLAPFSYYQANRIYTTHTAGQMSNGYAVVKAIDGNGCFMAYASVVDNQTADPIFIPGKRP
jgi:M6 family metalloprotease-like protein